MFSEIFINSHQMSLMIINRHQWSSVVTIVHQSCFIHHSSSIIIIIIVIIIVIIILIIIVIINFIIFPDCKKKNTHVSSNTLQVCFDMCVVRKDTVQRP
jgi:hypothetical protein